MNYSERQKEILFSVPTTHPLYHKRYSKWSYEQVVYYASLRGFKILDNSYENSDAKVNMLCPNDHRSNKIWPKFMAGQGCSECATEESKKTWQLRYGADHPMQVDKIKQGAQQTNMKKYGAIHVFQVPEIQAKAKQTLFNNYGVSNPMQNPDIYEENVAINMNKYGVLHPMQIPEIREKRNQTNMEKYGVSNAMQNQAIYERSVVTNMEKYGVSNPMFDPLIKENILLLCRTQKLRRNVVKLI